MAICQFKGKGKALPSGRGVGTECGRRKSVGFKGRIPHGQTTPCRDCRKSVREDRAFAFLAKRWREERYEATRRGLVAAVRAEEARTRAARANPAAALPDSLARRVFGAKAA